MWVVYNNDRHTLCWFHSAEDIPRGNVRGEFVFTSETLLKPSKKEQSPSLGMKFESLTATLHFSLLQEDQREEVKQEFQTVLTTLQVNVLF
jgi:hypothetical protein